MEEEFVEVQILLFELSLDFIDKLSLNFSIRSFPKFFFRDLRFDFVDIVSIELLSSLFLLFIKFFSLAIIKKFNLN